MDASISFDGTLSGSIAGGGGGGSDVSITPTYHQGTKIADYSIDGNDGAIYIPEIEISKNVLSGVKICEIEGVKIYCPSYGYVDTLGDSNVEQIGGFSEGLNVTPVNVKRVSYTDQSGVDGEIIGVLSVGDSDYNIKQKKGNAINYSLNERDTDLLWYDGRHIYQKTFEIPITSTVVNVSVSDLEIDIMISVVGVSVGAVNQLCVPYYQTPDFYQCVGYERNNKNIVVISGNNVASSYGATYITIRYVKEVA